MKDKIYPAFYRDTDKSIYLYSNADNYYCFVRGLWDQTSDEDGHENDTNITREYLANTYGKVESKDHAEFVVELAEVNDFKVCSEPPVDGWFCFSGSRLWFFSSESRAGDNNEKQITIPMPPKEVEVVDEWPKVGETVLTASKCKVKVLATYNKKAWIVYVSDASFFKTVNIASLLKLKTPEEELQEELIDVYEQSLDGGHFVDNLLSKFTITKKQ